MEELKTRSFIQSVRGMHDILPDKIAGYNAIENWARKAFSLYGYQEIRIPVLESVELFERAIGQTTDIVEKEMFTLKDRGERTLCLRPEGTAGVVRAFLENGLETKYGLVKLFYIGSMFRAERPQKGRLREFVQIGAEYFGNDAPSADVEMIDVVTNILQTSGIPLEIHLNSIGCPECRPKYLQTLLQFLKSRTADLCENCQKRMEKNPLRALDCKEDISKLQDAPQSEQHLCKNCLEHYEQVKKLLSSIGNPFKTDPHLVRGLDYYTRTVFEIYPSGQIGSQDALAAGGRYDTLVEDLGGNKTPAVGFALGVERILNFHGNLMEHRESPGKVFVVSVGSIAIEKSFQILNDLRKNGIAAQGVLNNQSLKSQMRLADRIEAKFCVIVGENEIKENVVTLRDLQNKSQEIVSMNSLADVLKNDKKVPVLKMF